MRGRFMYAIPSPATKASTSALITSSSGGTASVKYGAMPAVLFSTAVRASLGAIRCGKTEADTL